MGLGRRITVGLTAIAFVAAGIVFPARGNPDCSPGDLLNALENTLSSISSPACAAAAAATDGGSYAVSVGLAATLGGIAADSSQGQVNQICGVIDNAVNNVNNGQNDASSLQALLEQNGISGSIAGDVASVLGSVGSAVGVASCACSMEEGVQSLGNDLGACIQSALCWGDALIGSPCTCTPPPPILANCSLPTNSCGYFDANQACQGANTIIKGPAGYEPVTQINEGNGTFVSVGGDSSDGNGHCSAVQYCFCPKPLVPTWLTDYALDSSGQFAAFTCACPTGTHSAGNLNGSPVCLCDSTNQPAQPPGSLLGMCPPPTCPAGQVMIDNKCVATCRNPGQVLLPSGQCCSPSQTTSCGECCPAGQTPDPRTGSCVRNYTPIPTPIRPAVPGGG
jgi:hypothetical protein